MLTPLCLPTWGSHVLVLRSATEARLREEKREMMNRVRSVLANFKSDKAKREKEVAALKEQASTAQKREQRHVDALKTMKKRVRDTGYAWYRGGVVAAFCNADACLPWGAHCFVRVCSGRTARRCWPSPRYVVLQPNEHACTPTNILRCWLCTAPNEGPGEGGRDNGICILLAGAGWSERRCVGRAACMAREHSPPAAGCPISDVGVQKGISLRCWI